MVQNAYYFSLQNILAEEGKFISYNIEKLPFSLENGPY